MDTDRGEEGDIEETEAERGSVVKISAQSSFSDSGLGGNNTDTEDLEKGEIVITCCDSCRNMSFDPPLKNLAPFI